SIGEKAIAGQPAQGFEVQHDNQQMTIWVDKKTRLPVEMEILLQLGELPPSKATATQFEWDAKIDESLLSLDPPAGYEVQQLDVDASPPTERDLLDTLRKAAELNG